MVSSRIMTLDDIASVHFNGCKRFILHRMVFKKMFGELLKVFKSGTISPELLN